MITPMALQDGINDFLEKEVAPKYSFKSLDRDGEEKLKNPQIVRTGWILPKSVDDESVTEEEFPYIITRIDKVEHIKGSRERVLTMKILLGVYDPGMYDSDGRLVKDGSGYRDFWNLQEGISQALFIQGTIANRYRIIEDFYEAEMLEEQIYPYWEGFCKTKWSVVYPLPQFNTSDY